MASATLCFSRRTQRRGRQLHRCQNCGKHRARLLTEKALCCCGPVRPREEKVVHSGEALPLARQIESSQLMAAQGEVAVAPLHIGTRALAHGGESLGFVMEVVLSLRTPLTHDPTKFKQRGAQSLSEFVKRLTLADVSSLGHAIEIVRGDELSVHGKGDGRRQVELRDLLTDITRDELAGRLHFRHHPLGFRDALQAALAQSFLLGQGAHLLDVLLDISGNELAVAAHPALQSDTRVVVANATETRLDLCTVLRETRGLTTGRCERRLGVLQTHGCFWGAPWTAL